MDVTSFQHLCLLQEWNRVAASEDRVEKWIWRITLTETNTCHLKKNKNKHPSLLLSMSSAWAAKTCLLSAQSWKRKWQLQHFTAHKSLRSKVIKEENREGKKSLTMCTSLKKNKKLQENLSEVTVNTWKYQPKKI